LAGFDLEAGAFGLAACRRGFARFTVFIVATRFFDIIAPSSESGNHTAAIGNW
jgi:hypothetical protein